MKELAALYFANCFIIQGSLWADSMHGMAMCLHSACLDTQLQRNDETLQLAEFLGRQACPVGGVLLKGTMNSVSKQDAVRSCLSSRRCMCEGLTLCNVVMRC